MYRMKTFIYEYGFSKGQMVRRSKGSISQLPLKLAYATTVHKSQGATFEKANIEPGGWDPGQLYVSLSRVKDLKCLHLLRPLTEEDIIIDPLVQQFYNSIAV